MFNHSAAVDAVKKLWPVRLVVKVKNSESVFEEVLLNPTAFPTIGVPFVFLLPEVSV